MLKKEKKKRKELTNECTHNMHACGPRGYIYIYISAHDYHAIFKIKKEKKKVHIYEKLVKVVLLRLNPRYIWPS